LTHPCAESPRVLVDPDLSGPCGCADLWVHTGSSPSKGFGHLRRSMILARLLAEDPSVRITFVLTEHDQWSGGQIESAGFDVLRIGPRAVWPSGSSPAGLLVDVRGEEVSLPLVLEAGRKGIPVLSIHDLGLELLPSDILVDGSIAPRAFGEASSVVSYLGPDYLVLDPQFAGVHERTRQFQDPIYRVLIAPGGGDARAYLPKILEGLRCSGIPLDVTALRGFSMRGQEDVESASQAPVRFRWADPEESVPELCSQADLVVAAGGLSVYEALCAGTPAIAFAVDRFQHVTVASLAGLGACLDLGTGSELDPCDVAGGIRSLEGGAERARLSARGRELVDGRGACRVAELLRGMVGAARQPQRAS
jgi:spore coat polysaccharide biosynthesis predicted glycosyltransferase SpsG